MADCVLIAAAGIVTHVFDSPDNRNIASEADAS